MKTHGGMKTVKNTVTATAATPKALEIFVGKIRTNARSETCAKAAFANIIAAKKRDNGTPNFILSLCPDTNYSVTLSGYQVCVYDFPQWVDGLFKGLCDETLD